VPAALVRWGRVVGTHGLRGAVRIRLDNPQSDPKLFERCFAGKEGATARPLRVLEVSPAGAGAVRMVLEGVETIEAAQAMRGQELYIAKADLPRLDEGEFYYFEVMGFDVLTVAGQPLGRIAEVFSNGAHEVWVVRGERGEILIPVVDEVVVALEPDHQRAIIQPLAGLLE